MKAALLCILLLASASCYADDLEVSTGSAVIRGPAPVLDLTIRQSVFNAQQWHVQESLTLIDSSTWRGEHQSANAVVRGLLDYDWRGFTVGAGLSVMTETLPYNGSNVNFSLEGGYRWKHLVVQWIHQSNAGLTAHNEGRDIILAGYRW